MGYEPFHLGRKKHVFIDWDLVEPGYGLSFGGEKPESWEMAYGVHLTAHLPRIGREPLVTADRPWEEGNSSCFALTTARCLARRRWSILMLRGSESFLCFF